MQRKKNIFFLLNLKKTPSSERVIEMLKHSVAHIHSHTITYGYFQKKKLVQPTNWAILTRGGFYSALHDPQKSVHVPYFSWLLHRIFTTHLVQMIAEHENMRFQTDNLGRKSRFARWPDISVFHTPTANTLFNFITFFFFFLFFFFSSHSACDTRNF